jgi:hypothetical protein
MEAEELFETISQCLLAGEKVSSSASSEILCNNDDLTLQASTEIV